MRTMALGAGALLLLVAWQLFAPRQLGGSASYVTTAGTSMEPLLHQGDVAVVRSRSEYRVGDVVAYHNPDVGQVVLHRIVALDGDRFVMQGDNNTWFDAYHPAKAQILGEMQFHVPGLGKPLGAVRTPWGMSAMASLATLAVIGGRRRSRHPGEGPASAEHEDAPASRARNARGDPHRPPRLPANVAAVLGGVAALSLVLSVIFLSLASTTPVDHDVVYDQQGTFSYTARVPAEGIDVYGRDHVETGEPVYLELMRRVEVTFDYALVTEAPLDAGGRMTLEAEISDVNGWTRTVELAGSRSFSGSAARISGVLDLHLLRRMTAALERVTGVERDHYTVAVRPEVSVDGTLAGRPLARTFAPELRFFLDAYQLQVEPAGAAPPGEEVADPVHPVSGGLLKTRGTEPRTIPVLGLRLGLGPLRAATIALLILSLAGLGSVGVHRRRSAEQGEAAVIDARYGQWIVPVHPVVRPASGRTVEVESFDSLARLASHYGHVVLHEQGDGFHAYSIEENGVIYRYLVANGSRP